MSISNAFVTHKIGLIHSWIHPKLQVQETNKYDRGVFAKEKICAGERLAIFGGDVMHIDEIKSMHPDYQHYALQIEERFIIGIRNADRYEATDFFNHSCCPNAGIKGQIFLVAMRDILINEEVTFDYAMVVSKSIGSDIVFKMDCNCGYSHCRKTITEDDWKLDILQTKYKGYFSQYLEEKINHNQNLLKDF